MLESTNANDLPRATALSIGPSLSLVLAIVFGVAAIILGGVALTQARWLSDAQLEIAQTRGFLSDERMSLHRMMLSPAVQIQHSNHFDWKTRTAVNNGALVHVVDAHITSQCGDSRYEDTVAIPIW